MNEIGKTYTTASLLSPMAEATNVGADVFQQMLIQLAGQTKEKGTIEAVPTQAASDNAPLLEEEEAIRISMQASSSSLMSEAANLSNVTCANVPTEATSDSAPLLKEDKTSFEAIPDSSISTITSVTEEEVAAVPDESADQQKDHTLQSREREDKLKIQDTLAPILTALFASQIDGGMDNVPGDNTTDQSVVNQGTARSDLLIQPIVARDLLSQPVPAGLQQPIAEQSVLSTNSQHMPIQQTDPTQMAESQLPDASFDTATHVKDIGALSSDFAVATLPRANQPAEDSVPEDNIHTSPGSRLQQDAASVTALGEATQANATSAPSKDAMKSLSVLEAAPYSNAETLLPLGNQLMIPSMDQAKADGSGPPIDRMQPTAVVAPFEKIMQQRANQSSPQEQKITLQLMPEKLGTMKLTFAQHAEGSRLEFAFEQPQAKEVVLSIKHELTQVLLKQGQESFVVKEAAPVIDLSSQPQLSFASNGHSSDSQQRFMQQQQATKKMDQYMIAEEETPLEQTIHAVSILA